jgi:transcriptional regulator with XRE-family HTH domain
MIAEWETSKTYQEIFRELQSYSAEMIAEGTGLPLRVIVAFKNRIPIRVENLTKIAAYRPTEINTLCTLRKLLGKSQQQIGEILGLSQTSVNRIENLALTEGHKYYPHFEVLLELLKANTERTVLYNYLSSNPEDCDLRKILLRLKRRMQLTQAQIADKCKVSQAYISQLQSGKREMSIETLALIFERLGVTEKDLIDILK